MSKNVADADIAQQGTTTFAVAVSPAAPGGVLSEPWTPLAGALEKSTRPASFSGNAVAITYRLELGALAGNVARNQNHGTSNSKVDITIGADT